MTDTVNHYRSIFISDVHLGSKACSADVLLDFLKNNESNTLYLIGDIIDMWALKRSWYWPQSHNDVVQKILRKARKGTRTIYISGNHDELLRGFIPITFGDIELVNEVIHETVGGKKFLVIHGDDFDGILNYAKWISKLGDIAYNALLSVNRHYNNIRRKLGFEYWSLSAYLKNKVKNAVQFINNYSIAVVDECKRRGMDGIICGHIHNAEISIINDIVYCNDGDFCESCTALVEEFDGTLKILQWHINKEQTVLINKEQTVLKEMKV